jgi:hypothetical protein
MLSKQVASLAQLSRGHSIYKEEIGFYFLTPESGLKT